jgi:tRNA threonylcarbamoyladenosine biosynthesis protein TsaB
MKILAVDTALGACSTAVMDDKTILAHACESMERGHAERLAPMVREAMEAARLEFAALERLAVTIGPGTFTGQRVGYAFMRGLRLALKRPLIGVTTLEAMALAAMHETGVGCAAVLHDAKRGEVYVAVYESGRTVVPVQIAGFGEAVQLIRGAARAANAGVALAGTAAGAAASALRDYDIDALKVEIVAPDALWVARMALSAPEPETVPRPLYLRPPDARLPTFTA